MTHEGQSQQHEHQQSRHESSSQISSIRRLARLVFQVGKRNPSSKVSQPRREGLIADLDSTRSKIIRNGYESILFTKSGIKNIEEEMPSRTGFVYTVTVLPGNNLDSVR